MKKPVIGITTTRQQIVMPHGGHKSVTQINSAYVNLATDFGATPLLLYSEYEPEDVENIIDFLDGLILIGGQDLDALLYSNKNLVDYSDAHRGFGQRFKRPQSYAPNRRRDEVELQLYRLAKEKKIPIFGICRGLQLINVAEGGTLHQEIPENLGVKHYYDDDGFIHYHPITVEPKSLSAKLLGCERYFMSSLHHQAIDKLGSDLTKAAWSDDGLIEIIEHVDDDLFVLAVHGHVEQTRHNLPLYDNMLNAFFDRAKGRKP